MQNNVPGSREWWLEQSGRQFTIDGLKYRLKAQIVPFIYPYKGEMLEVTAEILNKSHPKYRADRATLGGDFVTDVLASEEFFGKVCERLLTARQN